MAKIKKMKHELRVKINSFKNDYYLIKFIFLMIKKLIIEG